MQPARAELTFWEHVGSLRSHVLWGAFFFIGAAALVFAYASQRLIQLLIEPLHGQQLIFLSPLDPFFFTLRISIYMGIALSLPVWLGLLLHFVYPALPGRKLRIPIFFVLASLVLSLASIFVTYFYFVPVTFRFLNSFIIPGTSFMLSANSYLSFFLLELAVVFIILQLPLLLNVLAYTRLLNPHVLTRQRRLLYIGLLIVLAVVTPTTDALTLTLVFIPTVILVESGLVIAKRLYDNQ